MEIKKLRLVHLYPNELNLYGDNGNILCIKRRLEKRGIELKITCVEAGESLPDFDLLFIGGGQDREMEILSRDVRKKADSLWHAISSGKAVFAVCGGFQLLGEYYLTAQGKKIKLSGALPFYTVGDSKRHIGNIVFETPFGMAVGFENHSGKTYLNGLPPLGNVIKGFGNNGEDKGEGLHIKNTFCTYAHGPFLPKNPAVCDELLCRAAKETLKPIDDGLEIRCSRQLINRYK